MDSPKLDSLLDELSDLARRPLAESEFYAAILRAVLETCHAQAAGLWSVIGEKYRLEADAGLLTAGLESDQQLQALHEEALAAVSGISQGLNHRAEHINSASEPVLLERQYGELEFRFFPCRDRGRAFLVLEVMFPIQNDLEWGFHGRLLAAISEIVNDYYLHRRLEWLETEQSVLGELVPILERIYGQPSSRQTAYEVANEGRRFLACDRVSVFQVRNGHSSLLAISGAERIHQGSRQVRALCDLVESVTLTGKELVYLHESADSGPFLPQQEVLVQCYLDSSACQRFHIVPWLSKAPESDDNQPSTRKSAQSKQRIGAIAIENWPSDQSAYADRLSAFSHHAQLAMDHAMHLESIPMLSWGRKLQKLSGLATLRRTALLFLSLLGIACLFVIPTDLTIQAKGRYQPGTVHHIYAPLNGEIVQFNNTQRSVQAGETLLTMRSREWELKHQEILTQRGVTLEKLRSVESARLNSRRSSTTDPNTPSDLSGNERELRELLVSQDQQLSIIQKMLDGLTISSPATGTILSWNPLENWKLRPVQQGQKLMTIAQDGGQAQLQLRIRDSDIRHLWTATKQTQSAVPITFSIASDPGARFQAQLAEIGSITESMPGEEPTVRAVATVMDADKVHAKHGATVLARIRCGRTSLAYAWTRRLCDYVVMHWLP